LWNRLRLAEPLCLAGIDKVYALAKRYKIKMAFGTDTLFSKALADRQGAQLAKLVRWYTPAEVLAMATSANGELLQLSGLRNPYPGTLGVVQEYATCRSFARRWQSAGQHRSDCRP
jgi:hypothetical protein